MLASITPLGERSRRQRWPVSVSALIVGATATGATVGFALAAAGRVPPLSLAAGWRLDLVLAVAVAGIVLELRPFDFALPSHCRQVNETWLHRYRGWVYGIGFGGQLGVGVLTIVTTPAVYVALLAEALAPTLQAGVLIGATFGFVRGATLLSTARINSGERLAAFHRRFHRAEGMAGAAAAAAQAVVVAAVIAVAL
jgi:hypothetical protein